MNPFALVVLDCFTGYLRRYSCVGRAFVKEKDATFGKEWRQARHEEVHVANVIQQFRRGEI